MENIYTEATDQLATYCQPPLEGPLMAYTKVKTRNCRLDLDIVARLYLPFLEQAVFHTMRQLRATMSWPCTQR